jgi:hypothetical protein
LRTLLAQAAAEGRGPEARVALEQIVARLQNDPHGFGEPRKRYLYLRLQSRIGSIRPLAVEYGVHETRPVVIVRRFFLLGTASA